MIILNDKINNNIYSPNSDIDNKIIAQILYELSGLQYSKLLRCTWFL